MWGGGEKRLVVGVRAGGKWGGSKGGENDIDQEKSEGVLNEGWGGGNRG